MAQMLLAYLVAIVLMLGGAMVLGYETLLLVFGEAGAVSWKLVLVGGVGSLAAGEALLGQARRLWKKLEGEHRRRYLLARLRSRKELVTTEEVARWLNLESAEAAEVLEELAREGIGELEVEESGTLLLRVRQPALLSTGKEAHLLQSDHEGTCPPQRGNRQA